MSLTRRRLLLATAGSAAGAALGGAAASSSAAPTGQLPPPRQSGLDHIVVVMMENRSFNHFLGWVPGADGRQAGLVYLDDHGRPHHTHHLSTRQGCGFNDPAHTYWAGRTQLNNGRCDGFARGRNDSFALGYYSRDDLPFYGPLASVATVCDRSFASVLTSTLPNRNYVHAGRTDRMDNHFFISRMPTIWDRLADGGVPATYYYFDVPYLSLWGNRYASMSQRFDQFLLQAASGTLPQVSYVEPPFDGRAPFGAADDHPHCDIHRGQAFLSVVAQALVNSPLWPKTALVITYDEWGGFFDHVPPPRLPDEPPLAGRDRHQAGFRVPTIILSPFARRGRVDHGVYDHASIVKLITWRFGLKSLATRDRYTRNLARALDFRLPDPSVPLLPVVPDPGPHECGAPGVGMALDESWAEELKTTMTGSAWRHV
ncbi:MAG TPA: alkaline phosphatase family protein [Mycobacteriales bacterium]|nr:alkaline phosphatase family protein [Mycobacteriales bacterium]